STGPRRSPGSSRSNAATTAATCYGSTTTSHRTDSRLARRKPHQGACDPWHSGSQLGRQRADHDSGGKPVDDFVADVTAFLGDVSGVVWGPFVLIPLLLGVGLVLTVRLRGLQFRKLGAALRLGIIKRRDAGAEDGDVSQFQALTTALAATVGTGNIVGVATAIGIGGPGALFWMWVTGLVGMASKYSEAFLGVYYRRTDAAGEKSGGPQYYLERGIRGP